MRSRPPASPRADRFAGWIPAPAPGSVALVTGASSGIGADVARSLARRGHDLLLVARRRDRLEALARELSARGVTAEAVVCDLSAAAERQRLAAAVSDRGLVVSVLCNVAGAGRPGRLADADPDGQCAMLRLNLEALVDLCARYVPAMVQRGQGAILNVGSLSSFAPLPSMATYAASKAAVLSFSEALHVEVRPLGVAVTALCPGFVRTEFIDTAGLAAAAADAPRWVFEDARGTAERGVRALDRNRRVVVPSALYRSSAAALRVLPNALVLTALDRWSPFRRGGPIAGVASGQVTSGR